MQAGGMVRGSRRDLRRVEMHAQKRYNLLKERARKLAGNLANASVRTADALSRFWLRSVDGVRPALCHARELLPYLLLAPPERGKLASLYAPLPHRSRDVVGSHRLRLCHARIDGVCGSASPHRIMAIYHQQSRYVSVF